MTKFGLFGNGPLSNRGCEAIVHGTIKILENEFGPSNFLLASFAENPSTPTPENIEPLALPYKLSRWTKDWWKYKFNNLLGKPEDKSGFLKILEKNLDNIQAALIIGGDGYAIDYGHQIIDRLIIMGDYLKEKGIPTIVWGASIGPFDKEPNFEDEIIKHLANLDLLVVREPLSYKYLSDLGIKHNLFMAPDPAFVLESLPCNLNEKTEDILKDGCIGVNLSPLLAKYAVNSSQENWSALASQIVRQILSEIKIPVLLIPHVTSNEYQTNIDDEIFMQRIYQGLSDSEKKQISILPRDLSSNNLKWIISRTQVFVGARTHSTIAALSSCVPCLSIAYSRKAWGINELIFGHHDWVYSSKELDAEGLIHQINKLVLSSDRVRLHLNKVIPEKKVEAYLIAKRVRAVIS